MNIEENQIVIEDREELIYMLSEASQLEHMLMCEYLFAAFSLKTELNEGLTPPQLEAVSRWKSIIMGVAAQEMLHLALVANLHTAIGAFPHFNRPNFPQRSRWYPAEVQVDLLPFGQQALEHFLFLERPEGMKLSDAASFEINSTNIVLQNTTHNRIVPVLQDFATVGHLYRGIEQGFRHLVDKYGQEQVFIGPPAAQATSRYFNWPELVSVTNLASALEAIETIVHQGEGARGDWNNAHYGKFRLIYQEYLQLKQQDSTFAPGRPAQLAWVAAPGDASQLKLISDPYTAAVSDLFNASYQLLLQILIRFFLHGGETEAELQVLSNVAVDTMFKLIEPLGQLLTRLPLGPEFPGLNAGPNFEIYRTGYILPHRHAAWLLIQERLLELADYSGRLVSKAPAGETGRQVAEVEETFRQMARTLAQPETGN